MVSSLYQVDKTIFSEKFLKKENFGEIFELGKSGTLSMLNNRLTCWRLFLNIFQESDPVSKWISDLSIARQHYISLKHQYYSEDFDLKSKISASENVQKLNLSQDSLFEILKIWLELHNIDYKEDYLEILCIVLTVTETEKFTNSDQGEAEEILRELNNKNFISSDAFSLFNSLMSKSSLSLQLPAQFIKKEKPKTILELKCARIYHFYLKSLDPELYNFLQSKQIETERYISNWILCLFTMEFSVSAVIAIWDFIFSIEKNETPKLATCRIQPNLEMATIDFICVAMLMNIRDLGNTYKVMEENVHRINMHLSAYTLVTDIESLFKTAYKSLEFFTRNSCLKFEFPKEEVKENKKKNNATDFFGMVKGGLKKLSFKGIMDKFKGKKQDKYSNVRLDMISIGKNCDVEDAIQVVDEAIEVVRGVIEGIERDEVEIDKVREIIENLKKIKLD